jgi:hypothetical protein
MTDTELMRELEFTADDLAVNRAGHLSETQLDRLRARRKRSIATGIAIMLLLAFIASLCIFGGIQGSGVLLIIGIGLTLISAVITGTFARYWLRLSADIRENTVSAFSGQLERVVKPVNRRVVAYLVRIGGAEFTVNKEQFKAFAHEAQYTLYRAKYTGTLLSAEGG